MGFNSVPTLVKNYCEHLKAGGILAYPTETVWGLGVDISNTAAIKKLFELKGRDTSKAISVLVGNIYEARRIAEIEPACERLMNVFWPGPVTFVVKAKKNIPMEITGGTGFVGLRCSNHPFVMDLVRELGCGITSTSANKSGEPPAQELLALLRWLPKDVLKVDWQEDRHGLESKGSTVVKIADGQLSLLRQGDVEYKFIEAQFNK